MSFYITILHLIFKQKYAYKVKDSVHALGYWVYGTSKQICMDRLALGG